MCYRGAVRDPVAVGAAQATFAALQTTYDFLTPDLWQETTFQKQPLQEFTDFLAKCVCTALLPAPRVVMQGLSCVLGAGGRLHPSSACACCPQSPSTAYPLSCSLALHVGATCHSNQND